MDAPAHDADHPHHGDPAGREPPATIRSIVIALVVLVALTAASWALANVHLGPLHAIVPLVIAALKAIVVVAVFMELWYASVSVRVVAFVTLAFILLLCGGIVADVAFR